LALSWTTTTASSPNWFEPSAGYLEHGGSYDDTAKAMHIHRSTLRYRLARVRELTGRDVRDIDTRFNLDAATRAWRFLNPEG
jgi:DNA-binding PucR family transcriptional regulator